MNEMFLIGGGGRGDRGDFGGNRDGGDRRNSGYG